MLTITNHMGSSPKTHLKPSRNEAETDLKENFSAFRAFFQVNFRSLFGAFLLGLRWVSTISHVHYATLTCSEKKQPMLLTWNEVEISDERISSQESQQSKTTI